jgi:hypothetical protein
VLNPHIVMSLIPLPDFLMHGVVLHFSCFRNPAPPFTQKCFT